jgi:hypothetical protein
MLYQKWNIISPKPEMKKFSMQFFSSLMKLLLILPVIIFLFHAVYFPFDYFLILCFIFKVYYFSACMTAFSI